MTTSIQERDKHIKEWIFEAAKDIREELKNGLEVETKTNRKDLVTNMDKQIEEELTKKIRKYYPNDLILGEEGYGDQIEDLSGTVWFIDPIDGTLNFVLQEENYAIMIAVYEDGVGMQGYIYDVISDKLYYAIKGLGAYCNEQQLENISDIDLSSGMLAINTSFSTQERYASARRKILKTSMGIRMIGSAGLEAVEIAKGSNVAYIASSLKPWDIAPGKVIVEELGGKVTQMNGEPIDLLCANRTVFATPSAHVEIVNALDE